MEEKQVSFLISTVNVAITAIEKGIINSRNCLNRCLFGMLYSEKSFLDNESLSTRILLISIGRNIPLASTYKGFTLKPHAISPTSHIRESNMPDTRKAKFSLACVPV